MHKHSGEGVGLTPPRSLATIRVVWGARAPNRSKSIDLLVPGYTPGTSIWRVPRSSPELPGGPGDPGGGAPRGARTPDFGTPQLPGRYLQNRGFWQNPHIKPLHLYGYPHIPQIWVFWGPSLGGRDVRGVPNWRIIKYRPGVHPRTVPQGPRWGPWSQAAPCHLANMAILAILGVYQIWDTRYQVPDLAI